MSSLAILIIFNYRYTPNNESVVCRSIRTGLLLTRKLLNQGFLLIKLKSSLRKFWGRHHDLVNRNRWDGTIAYSQTNLSMRSPLFSSHLY